MGIKKEQSINSGASKKAQEVFDKLNGNSPVEDMNLIQFTIRLDKTAIAKLSVIAREMGLNKTAAVRYAVNRFIKDYSSKDPLDYEKLTKW